MYVEKRGVMVTIPLRLPKAKQMPDMQKETFFETTTPNIPLIIITVLLTRPTLQRPPVQTFFSLSCASSSVSMCVSGIFDKLST